MPDFERITRKLEIDLATNDRKPVITAFHAGLDRARTEVAIIAAIVAAIVTIAKVLA